CVLQTLPWHQNFMLFHPAYEQPHSAIRSVLPPDDAWLAMMHRAGAFALSDEDDSDDESQPFVERYKTFDRNGSFELRYYRYRRYNDKGEPRKYLGECEFERNADRYRPD